MTTHANNLPKLHNAAWPGVVGKGPDSEPPIELDTMLDLTAAAEVDGVQLRRRRSVPVRAARRYRLVGRRSQAARRAGPLAQPGHRLSRRARLAAHRRRIGDGLGGRTGKLPHPGPQGLQDCQAAARAGARPYGVVRIDSAVDPGTWSKGDPDANSKRIAATFREAATIAQDHGERLAAEGEICWGGMHSWRRMVQLLELVDRPNIVGFQADMAHTLLYLLGYNAPEDRILPANFDWKDTAALDAGLNKLTAALRPWTIDFHVAQNDGTVRGSGSHDKTGRHCLADDPNGRLNIPRDAGHWLRDEKGQLTKRLQHICWDGCMFPNDVLMKPRTWNTILATMIAVRDAHGWRE